MLTIDNLHAAILAPIAAGTLALSGPSSESTEYVRAVPAGTVTIPPEIAPAVSPYVLCLIEGLNAKAAASGGLDSTELPIAVAEVKSDCAPSREQARVRAVDGLIRDRRLPVAEAEAFVSSALIAMEGAHFGSIKLAAAGDSLPEATPPRSQRPTIAAPLALNSITFPDEIGDLMMPFMRCRLAAAGMPLPGGPPASVVDPPVPSGEACNSERNTALDASVDRLKRLGKGRNKGERIEFVEKVLLQVEEFARPRTKAEMREILGAAQGTVLKAEVDNAEDR